MTRLFKFGAKHSLLYIDFGKSRDLDHLLENDFFMIFDVKVVTSSKMEGGAPLNMHERFAGKDSNLKSIQ